MSTIRDGHNNYLGNIDAESGYVTTPGGYLVKGVKVYSDGEVWKYGKPIGKIDDRGYYWDRYSGQTDYHVD